MLTSKQNIANKVVRFAPQKSEAYDETEQNGNSHPLAIVTEAKHTASSSHLSGVFETINVSPRSSFQLLNLSGPSTTIDISPRSSLLLVLPDNAPLKGPVEATTAPLSTGKASTSQISKSTQTDRTSIHDVAPNTLFGTEEGETSSLNLYQPNVRTPSGSATSVLSVGKGSIIQTPRAQHTRGLSNATTLMGSVSRYEFTSTCGAALMPKVEFRQKLDQEYQILEEIQGQRDRRTVQQDQDDYDDRAIGIDVESQHNDDDGEPTTLEEQAKIYEALLEKAKQDGEDALATQQDEYDDKLKHLRNDLEAAQDNHDHKIKEMQKVVDTARTRRSTFEERLKKVLREQTSTTEENRALSEECKGLKDDVALRDEQLVHMSSALQNRQQELDSLRGLYKDASTQAKESARLLEDNSSTIHDLRQSIQTLTSQLALSGQQKQAPGAAFIDSLRNENDRLLGILAEDHSLMEAARAKISALTQAVSQAKREHDCWTDDQMSAMPEDSFSDRRKIENHLAYKDKLYKDLEKRFQAYTAANEEQQKEACENENEASKIIEALRKDLEIQNEAVERARKDKEMYRGEMEKIFTTTLGQMPQERFVEGLCFHFDLVRKDNHALATKVTELDQEVTNLKQEVTGHERDQKNLVKELEAHKEAAHQLEEAKTAAMGEVDALKYTAEVAEEGRKEEVKNYQTSLIALSTELKTMGDRFSALNRESASERIRFELDSKDEHIRTLKSRLTEIHQAWIQACNERERYRRVTEWDNSLRSCTESDVSFLQRQLRLAEDKFNQLRSNLDTAHMQRIREAWSYKEAYELEKVRVEDLENQLHKLYQNLQGEASNNPDVTPAHTTASQPARDKSLAIEELAMQLWERMRGLEITLKALGKIIVEPDNGREELRLACEELLGVQEEENNGSPQINASVEDVGEGNSGNGTTNGEDGKSNDQPGEKGADRRDQEVQQQDEYARVQRIINEACDQLGYAPDDPRRGLGGTRTVGGVEEVEVMEGSEDAAGLGSSTEAVLGEDEDQGSLEDGEGPQGGPSPEEAAQGAAGADDEGGSIITNEESELGGNNGDDDRTVTQAEYNAATTTIPQHAPTESNEGAAGQSPPSEGDPDDSLNMTPGTWARTYAPPFMYGEPVEDDMF